MAAFSEIRLDWVRWTFALLTIFSAGIFALVYIAMAFLLPVVGSHEEWVAALDAPEGA